MKKIIYFWTTLLILFNHSISLSQYQNVKINPAGKTFLSGEVCLKINPKNTNQVVAGIMANYSPLTTIMGYCYSTNSGLNWSSAPITCTFAQPGSDPIIIVDTLGNFYYICCANWGVPGPNLDKLLCFKSTNGGANWDGGTAFALNSPKMDDMPMACVDMSHSQYGNNIYVTCSLYDGYPSSNPNDSCYVVICRSTDMGASFSPIVRISNIAGTAKCDNSSPEGISPCTGPDGEVYAVWPLNETVMFNRSTDAGVTWLANDIYVCNQVGGWWGTSTISNWSPVAACDISNSPYRGTVYICFADNRSGVSDKDIWLVKSTNKGNTWSTPKRVNNDGAGNMQYLPWICVDRYTGYIWIVFYDSRGNSMYTTNAYIARSTDGGNTFQNVKISTLTSSLAMNGEYISIDTYKNIVRPLWAKPVGGYSSVEVYTALIDTFYNVGINNIRKEIPSSFSLHQNYPNPFNTTTKIKFDVPRWSQNHLGGRGIKGVDFNVNMITLKIYDILGKEIATIVNEKLNPGTYEVTINGSNLSSGVYFYRFTVDGFTDVKKFLLLK